jgi:HAD superfamily hydrolase (TIGR01509 family)
MIKLIIFDFDGVIADCKEIHYQSLNQALAEVDSKFIITKEEHVSIFDGLSTKKKLNLLSSTKGFPQDKIIQVYDRKQVFTLELMESHLSYDQRLLEILSLLKKEGYLLYLASNAIRETIEAGLKKLGVFDLFDKIYSNQDVINQKPHPEIYLKCMVDAGVKPKETVIVEDSKHGREAAVESGAHVCGVDNPTDVSYEKIKRTIDCSFSSKVKWAGKDVTVLIPMAGAGSRFQQAGFKLPKPLIDVNGKPMIQVVVENLNIDANFVFVVQKAHYEQYNLGILLPLIAPGCKIVQTEGLTQGAACTSLLAKEFINNNDHLLIANSDQFVEWNSCDFIYSMLSAEVDGGILSFNDTNPKWSFAKVDDLGYVTEVAEKNPISDIATVGIYYFNKGKEYVHFAEQMINKNIRVNNEFYICPIYNEYIQAGKKIKTKNCNKMWGMGVPEDLAYFIENFK